MKNWLKLVASKTLQLSIVLLGGGLMLLFLSLAMSPTAPDYLVNWTWIEAPKLPFLWHRGWWLSCTTAAHDSEARCTLLTGKDHSVVYSGAYLPCDGPTSLSEADLKPDAPQRSRDMWVVTQPDHQLAPIVHLRNGTLLVPASVLPECAQLKTR